MNEWLLLKDAAAECQVDPSLLRHEIRKERLAATKQGGRDWWIQRGEIVAWNARRRPAGRPLESTKEQEDAAQARARKYAREAQRRWRAQQKAAAKGNNG